MNTTKLVALSAAVLLTLAACGGGGGGGSPALPIALPTTPSVPTTPPAPAAPTAAVDILNARGMAISRMTTVEISTVNVIVKNADGSPAVGRVVKFSETGGSLLTFAPVSATGLTDATGAATIEIRAAAATGAGATTVVATTTVSGATVTAEKSIAISSVPSQEQTDPQALVSAIGFLDVNPADKSIVIAGSGGNGRSESASLRFRIVDSNNTPVKGAKVGFSVNPPNDVSLNIASAQSDADGVVVTTVSSKSVTTAVVVTAKVDGRAISSQSDQLLVTTGVATSRGFDLSATKFNLNGALSGDVATITARIVDAAGNPVADGVPVVFTTNYLAVGTSSRGGCITANGACTVPIVVQEPRPADGEYVTVTASTRVGTQGDAISKSIRFTANQIPLLDLYSSATGGTVVRGGTVATCDVDQSFVAFVGTPEAFPAPANSTVALTSLDSNVTVTLKSDATIPDQVRDPRVRTPLTFNVKVDPKGCISGSTATIEAKFTSPSGFIVSRNIVLTLPAAPAPAQ